MNTDFDPIAIPPKTGNEKFCADKTHLEFNLNLNAGPVDYEGLAGKVKDALA